MSHVDRYEREDRIALERALLGLKTCPHCRADLKPDRLLRDVWVCAGSGYPEHPFETWHLPNEITHD